MKQPLFDVEINPMRDFSKSKLLPQAVAAEIRKLIIEGVWPPGMQMPGELELTEQLGVSRGTLRAALEELIAQGYVVRRHGVGTFIHQRPLITNNLHINSSVAEMIKSMGMRPGCIELDISVENGSEQVLAELDIHTGIEVIVIKRIRTANDKPVIYSVDYMDPELLKHGKKPLTIQELRSLLCIEDASLYNILDHRLGVHVDHALAEIKPIKADELLVKKLLIHPDSVLLRIRQIDYTKEGLPVMVSTEYHVAEISTHYIYRKR